MLPGTFFIGRLMGLYVQILAAVESGNQALDSIHSGQQSKKVKVVVLLLQMIRRTVRRLPLVRRRYSGIDSLQAEIKDLITDRDRLAAERVNIMASLALVVERADALATLLRALER